MFTVRELQEIRYHVDNSAAKINLQIAAANMGGDKRGAEAGQVLLAIARDRSRQITEIMDKLTGHKDKIVDIIVMDKLRKAFPVHEAIPKEFREFIIEDYNTRTQLDNHDNNIVELFESTTEGLNL